MTGFTSLAVELIENVTKNVNMRNFCNLRLSCRNISFKSKHQFCKRFYAKKTINEFLFSSEGFQSCLAMFNTPGLADYVQHLEITNVSDNIDRSQSDIFANRVDIGTAFSKLKNMTVLSIHPKGCQIRNDDGHYRAIGRVLTTLSLFFAGGNIPIKKLCVGCAPHDSLELFLASGSSLFQNLDTLQSSHQASATTCRTTSAGVNEV